ncbi:LysR substrate-binding domain-containing protein [Streptomyces sp. BI20]|uniref:LysR substrate-binding domain-containing protein n=1 Tax=Streptomyces sp. BI20 TaxID=3403460 RepID=UPI003C716FBD
MLDVRRLRLLRELAHRGTIAAVAEALNFSPSAVSQQLSTLEREAGLPLLERTGRKVSLTPAALALVGHAEAVLRHLERAEGELARARGGLGGVLRLGAFPTAARSLVPEVLTDLGSRHPALEVHVTETDPAGVAQALRGGDLDLALRHAYDLAPLPEEPGLETRALFHEPLHLAAPAARRPADGDGAGDPWAVLAEHRDDPWITATPGTLCHTMLLGSCRAAGFTPRIRHRVDEFATALALVAAGQGVTVVPALGLPAGGPPPGVRLTALPMRRHTVLAVRAGGAGHPASAAFAAALRAAAAEDPRLTLVP